MRVICYGDSNTFGFDPRSFLGSRYDASCRWVDILAAETGWAVRNYGTNGLEIPRHDVSFSESPDLLIVMLGTNDLLQGADPEATARRMGNFLERLSVDRRTILLIAPPPLKRGEWVTENQLVQNAITLGSLYRRQAEEKNVLFADAGAWSIPLAFDGVHMTEEGNKRFAANLLRHMKQHLFLD